MEVVAAKSKRWSLASTAKASGSDEDRQQQGTAPASFHLELKFCLKLPSEALWDARRNWWRTPRPVTALADCLGRHPAAQDQCRRWLELPSFHEFFFRCFLEADSFIIQRALLLDQNDWRPWRQHW